jgi:hypothetical protein
MRLSQPSLSLLQLGMAGRSWENNSSVLLCPSPGPLPILRHPHPPEPKCVGYLTHGCLATAVPGRGVGVWPEVALTREWRDGRRRLQGDVGFGEGRPRWARFLRQREARELGAATVGAEERVSRSQTCHLGKRGLGPEYHIPPGLEKALTSQVMLCLP